ncbi:enoyl-CoA hydratase [Paucimonas lemoignei]|uniref:Enoyl-CoA hydratase n=1 Tax=Paucimonas lemoignei TaxID=29443 RepID=A0A4R3HXP7_PAULE|nr:enoyl-CoA hydratase [Paucimonas lemoignei]TCS36975.1 enoyl-CoA hydratase [Paucimonas lemoignei]
MDIASSKADGVLTIQFNRPDKKNAFTAAMYQAMTDALHEAENDALVRAILFTGNTEAFTAGNDLEDFLNEPPTNPDAPVFRFMAAVTKATKPLVAVVAGNAVGIGTTLLLHCELVYAADNAKFALPFAKLGVCPEFASSFLLPQLAGYQRAAEALMLGETFGAKEACDMGLVNRVLPKEELAAFALAQAGKLAALPPSSIRITKQLMKAGRQAAVSAQMAEEIRHFAAMLFAPAAQEAVKAFLEKRKPDFSKLPQE